MNIKLIIFDFDGTIADTKKNDCSIKTGNIASNGIECSR